MLSVIMGTGAQDYILERDRKKGGWKEISVRGT